jgi:OOP family OmpA-OmpF porin
MVPPPASDLRRFRRRILAIAGVVAVAGFVVGVSIVTNRIEDDLERRVPVALAAAGFEGVSASFSGQTGTLVCRAPLSDPIAAEAVAYSVRGVRSIEPLDLSCRVNTASDPSADTVPVETQPGVDTVPVTSSEADGAPTETSTADHDIVTVGDIISASPDLSLLSVLIGDAGFDSVLDDTDPITIFAPSNSAFDELSADAIAVLNDDRELLLRVLNHHAVAGRLLLSDLQTGPLDSIDGSVLEVEVTTDTATVDGATITAPDTAAENGVVHIIDRLLLPDDVELSAPQPQASVSATFEAGMFTLDGLVASEVVRAQLVQAAAGPDGGRGVVDQLVVDPDTGLDTATAVELGQLISAMPPNLLSGVALFDGNLLSITGVYLTEADRDTVMAIADSFGAVSDLSAPPPASEIDAADLEAELNAFVVANPILFEPGSPELSESATAVLDEVARLAQQFEGIKITVEGHTDSDGSAGQNAALSQVRAAAVRDALIERGLAEDAVDFQGFGSAQPVLVDGVEDKAASRRVEFRVVTV